MQGIVLPDIALIWAMPGRSIFRCTGVFPAERARGEYIVSYEYPGGFAGVFQKARKTNSFGQIRRPLQTWVSFVPF